MESNSRTGLAIVQGFLSFAMSHNGFISRVLTRVRLLVLLISGGSIVVALGATAPLGFVNTGDLISARSFHAATLLRNGKVLAAGGLGSSGSLTSAELYNPKSRTWSATGSLITARFYYTATLLLDGKVLVAGGYNTNGHEALASAELFLSR